MIDFDPTHPIAVYTANGPFEAPEDSGLMGLDIADSTAETHRRADHWAYWIAAGIVLAALLAGWWPQ